MSGGEIDPTGLAFLADLLEAHVRFEEQDLFPMIEDGLSESELLDLATAGRRDV
jgi:hypothetical protein